MANTPVCHVHLHQPNPTIAVVQHGQCMQCLQIALFPGENFQQILLLERVETRTTVSTRSTASNLRGPGRTIGNILSILGRKLESILTTPPEVVLHRKAERDLQEAKEKLSKYYEKTKVLLLSSADSAKSELLKQMLLMQISSYNVQEREAFRPQVLKHLTRGMLRILSALDDRGLSLSDDNKHYAEHVQNARDLDDWEPFPISLYYAFSSLWSDPNVRDIWVGPGTYGVPESLSYFFSSLTRLFDIAYIPTEEDILNLGFQTKGDIIETTFSFLSNPLNVTIVDADECRRKHLKWMHRFADVECLLFVVDLSGYDESLVEDLDANQMQDALRIWDSICHSEFFRQISLILFFNKYELFEQKIRTSHIRDYFPDYEGAIGDASEGVQYFRKRFSRSVQKSQWVKEREVYFHVTTSTDTGMLRVLLRFLRDITLSRLMRDILL